LKLAASESYSRAVVAELKRLRLAAGISQQALADTVGVSRTAITHIEAGNRNPTLVICHALAVGLGTDLAKVVRRAEGPATHRKRSEKR
jgi:DNA-binding XRE family transcriptional regulator